MNLATVAWSGNAQMAEFLALESQSRRLRWRDAALALHREQLAELDRDLMDGRIGIQAHAAAVLEVQRRMLTSAGESEAAPVTRMKIPLLAILAVLPLIALTLYLTDGSPSLPSIPRNAVVAEPMVGPSARDAVLARLRSRVIVLDPASTEAQSDYITIGRIEADRGNMPAAAAAWNAALRIRFDPTLAAMTAEAFTEADGHVSGQAAALFRQALASAPADAPWRPVAEKRLRENVRG